MTGIPGDQQHLHQCQESYTHRTCRMGFSSTSFCKAWRILDALVSEVRWEVLRTLSVLMHSAFCFLEMVRDGYTMLTSQTEIQMSSSHPLSPVSAGVDNKFRKLCHSHEKSCSATVLKREIYLTLRKLFIQKN